MNTNEHQVAMNESTSTGPHLLNESIRFLQVVRRRLPTLILCTLFGGILGVVWYVTSTKKYESLSEIMVLMTEGNVLEGNNSPNQRSIQDIMPTYQRVLMSDRVVEGAISRLPAKHRVDFKGIHKSRWPNALRKNLSVGTARLTNLLTVRYVSKSPETAKFVVDAIVESYLDYMRDLRRDNSKESLGLLSREAATIGSQLREKEREVLNLKRDSGMLLHGNNHNTHVIIDQTVKLSDALIDAQRKTLESKSLLSAVEHALSSGTDIQPFLQQTAGEISREFLLREMGIGANDAILTAKREEELLTYQADLQAKRQFYGPNHPDIRKLEDKIRRSEEWLAERSNVIASGMKEVRDKELGPKLLQMVKQRLYQSKAHEDAIRQDFETIRAEAMSLNGVMAQIEIDEIELKRMRSYYDLVLEKMKKIDIGVDSGLKISVPTPAKVFSNAVAPKITTTVILCTLLGVVFGLGLIYTMDVLDDRFRSPDELQWQLGLPLLAMIREMEPVEGNSLDRIVTYAKPDSLESEAFRTLRSSITFSTMDTQRLVVTSTEPGDGKTTTLANLAVAFAQAKKKTLLIDADLRRPGMTQLLELKGPRGLSQILRDTKPVAESCLENIFNLGLENLDVMPSGPRPANPSELLASERLNDIIAWAESIYDQILIDAPPVLAVTDPAIIGRMVDGAIVVVRPDKNRRKMVLRAIDTFRASGVQVVGLVANHIANSSGSEYNYGYGYGYGHGYGHDEKPEVGVDDIGDGTEDGNRIESGSEEEYQTPLAA